MKLLNIGFGNLINADRIVAVVSPDSAPIKRIISESKNKSCLIDATQGRKTRSVIMTDSNHVVISYLSTEMITARVNEFGGSSNEQQG